MSASPQQQHQQQEQPVSSTSRHDHLSPQIQAEKLETLERKAGKSDKKEIASSTKERKGFLNQPSTAVKSKQQLEQVGDPTYASENENAIFHCVQRSGCQKYPSRPNASLAIEMPNKVPIPSDSRANKSKKFQNATTTGVVGASKKRVVVDRSANIADIGTQTTSRGDDVFARGIPLYEEAAAVEGFADFEQNWSQFVSEIKHVEQPRSKPDIDERQRPPAARDVASEDVTPRDNTASEFEDEITEIKRALKTKV